jgi:hypothetical protein
MPPAKKPNKLFDCIRAINEKNASYQYSKKDCSGYMLLMWFSHATDCVPIINEINAHLFDIPDELVYHYLYKSVPQGSRFIKYDKGTKDKALLVRQKKIIQTLQDEYEMSKQEATQTFKRYLND